MCTILLLNNSLNYLTQKHATENREPSLTFMRLVHIVRNRTKSRFSSQFLSVSPLVVYKRAHTFKCTYVHASHTVLCMYFEHDAVVVVFPESHDERRYADEESLLQGSN